MTFRKSRDMLSRRGETEGRFEILLINTNNNAFPVPVIPAGLCMVAEAAERSGNAVTLLDFMFERDPIARIKAEISKKRYDLVGLSVRNIDNNDMQEPVFYIRNIVAVAAAIRAITRIPIVLGGAALAVMPQQIMRAVGVELAVIGDGEIVFPALLERLTHGRPYADLPGIAVIENGVYRANPPAHDCVTGCVAPDYDRWIDLKKYRSRLATVPVQTKQGCQFQCVYCTYRKIEGLPYRLAPPKSVAETVARLTSSGVKDVEFVDNVFNAPYPHALSVCEELIKAKVRARFLSLELNPAYFDNQLLVLMKRAGFTGIGITAESASDTVLTALRKGYTARDVHSAAVAVRANTIPCLWIFMLGGPGETRETVRETLKFAEKVTRPGDAAFFGIGVRIYPDTELEAIARRQGLLSLSPARMLAPVFYLSPEVDARWVIQQVRNSMNNHMNFMGPHSIGFRYLPLIHRLGYRLGLKAPLWTYTGRIRKGLRAAGMNV